MKYINLYPKELFSEATFKKCLKPFYQLLFQRKCVPIHNAYHIIAFILMKNKNKFFI